MCLFYLTSISIPTPLHSQPVIGATGRTRVLVVIERPINRAVWRHLDHFVYLWRV